MPQAGEYFVLPATLEDLNVVLTGPRGAGKTTVGILLAERLKKDYIDTDELVVNRAGLSVPDIFESYGEEGFRSLETEIAHEVGRRTGQVIATGGGMVMRTENINALRRSGVITLLTAWPRIRADRIGNDPNRPALTEHASPLLEQIDTWDQRRRNYLSYADGRFANNGPDPEVVVERMVNWLGSLTQPESL